MTAGSERFGRYLRSLREARHLTLDEVERLTENEAEPVTRSLLSRLENGKARVSTIKLLALARVYGVRLGLLAERLEIDHELAEDGATADDECSAAELMRRAREAGQRGLVHRALALYELAESRAGTTRDAEALRQRARLGVTRAMMAMARYRTARSLLEELCAEPLGETERAWTLFLLCRCYLGLQQHLLAGAVFDSLRRLDGVIPGEIHVQLAALRAELQSWEGRLDEALVSWLEAVDHARRRADVAAEVLGMTSLAGVERRRGRLAEARRWAERSRRQAEECGLSFHLVKALTEAGRIELAAGRLDAARREWSEGRRLARRLRLNADLFEIYLELWRLARREGRSGQTRACLRSLRHLSRFIDRLPRDARGLEDQLCRRGPVAGASEEESR